MQPWSEAELKACVEAYIGMLGDEQAGRSINKAAVRRSLVAGPLAERGEASVEFRMQNISAVLQGMNRPWIVGYKPAENVGPTNRDRIASYIEALDGVAAARSDTVSTSEPAVTMSDIVGNPDRIMGIKAIWGPVSSLGLCFGARGTLNEPNAYFSAARRVATLAASSPYLIAVGAGGGAPADIHGRAINLLRLGTVYGPTATILGEAEAARLERWSIAVLAHEVYRFRSDPHFVRELGFADLGLFSGLMDGVIRPAAMEAVWTALRDWPVDRVELPLPSNLYDTGKPRLLRAVTHRLPKTLSVEEGGRLWKEQLSIERDPAIAAEAKRLNLDQHGIYTCEACGFANGDKALFDAHHPTPLAAGVRITEASHLEVLCPLCHRRAHRRGSKLLPFSLVELREWVTNGRPFAPSA